MTRLRTVYASEGRQSGKQSGRKDGFLSVVWSVKNENNTRPEQ